MRVFPFIFVLFAALLHTNTIHAQAVPKLKPGDIRLPSGAVVRSPDTPSTVAAYKNQLQKKFDEMVGQLAKKSAQQRMAEMAKKAAARKDWTVKLSVVRWPDDHTLQSVCDEYVGNFLQPRMRPLSPKIDKLFIKVKESTFGQTMSCEYQVKDRLGLFSLDGSPLPKNGYKFSYLNLGKVGKILIAYLGASRDFYSPELVVDLLVIVPVPVKDTRQLSKYMIAVARNYFASKESNYLTLRLQALTAGSKPGLFRLPGRSVTAYKGANDAVVLVQSISYKFSNLQKSDGKMGKMQPFIEILALNQNLALALAGGPGGAKAKQYLSTGIYKDSRAVLDSAGVYPANAFEVDRVVVVSKEPFPGRRQGIRIPVAYERRGENWVAVNRKRQN